MLCGTNIKIPNPLWPLHETAFRYTSQVEIFEYIYSTQASPRELEDRSAKESQL